MPAIKAYKGFDKDWKCRDYQFELGKTFVHDGPVELCKSGFHACEAPLDCLSYYSIIDGHFAEVELDGMTGKKTDDTKRVGTKLTVKAKLNIAGLVAAQIEWAKTAVKDAKKNASGQYSKAASSGDFSKAASSGQYSTAASSGHSSTAASSGQYSTAASSGQYSTAASSGDSSKAASSGDFSKAASSGQYSTAASSGHSSTAASSGDFSKAASSGQYSTAASSGQYSTAASSGHSSTAASSGQYSKASCDANGFACVAGSGGRVKGNAGSALSLGYVDGANRRRIAVAYVGDDGIKPDTWYGVDQSGVFTAIK
jgi:hypothetical protein